MSMKHYTQKVNDFARLTKSQTTLHSVA